jgi:hypothetical protein
MKFRNATPHSLSIIEDDGNIVFMPKDFPAPRLAVTRHSLEWFHLYRDDRGIVMQSCLRRYGGGNGRGLS